MTHRYRFVRALLALALLCASPGFAIVLGPLAGGPALEPHAGALPPVRLLAEGNVEPLAALMAARDVEAEALAAIAEWNTGGNLPMREGFVRPLTVPRRVELGGDAVLATRAHAGGLVTNAEGGDLVWATEVRVAEAHRVRLKLADVHLPTGTRFWVHDPAGEEGVVFGLELGYRNELWTPSIGGDTIRLEVRIPAAHAVSGPGWSFEIVAVGEIVALDRDGRPLSSSVDPTLAPREHSCAVDAMCIDPSEFNGINMARGGIAKYSFVDGIFLGFCTGGLLNNTAQNFIPYFLTANHCMSTGAEAATIEATWRFVSNSCNSPSTSDSGRSNGASLMGTGAASDFTLLRMNNVPGGLFYLGWDSGSVSNGTTLHMVSHPFPVEVTNQLEQHYSRSVKISPAFTCDGVPTSRYHYSEMRKGGTFGGSSGAPLLKSGAIVVGQLLGGCGFPPVEGCDYDDLQVDGKFSQTYPSISQFLDPDPGGNCPAGFFSDPEYPDFCFAVTITPPGGTGFPGTYMDPASCLSETVCVAGQLLDRAEVFIRIVGPKPNGYLWPTMNKFSTSQIDIQILQISTQILKTYQLEGASPGSDTLEGLFDRLGFLP